MSIANTVADTPATIQTARGSKGLVHASHLHHKYKLMIYTLGSKMWSLSSTKLQTSADIAQNQHVSKPPVCGAQGLACCCHLHVPRAAGPHWYTASNASSNILCFSSFSWQSGQPWHKPRVFQVASDKCRKVALRFSRCKMDCKTRAKATLRCDPPVQTASTTMLLVWSCMASWISSTTDCIVLLNNVWCTTCSKISRW